MSFTLNPISAKEIQRQLGYKRYGTIWFLLHKIRKMMGADKANRILKGQVEMDEIFIDNLPLDPDKKKKRGRDSNKPKVIVMAENVEYLDDYGKKRTGRIIKNGSR